MTSVRVLSDSVNNVVVVADGRRLPGLVVQSDRLHEWLRLVQEGGADSVEILEEELRLSVAELDRVSTQEGYPVP